MVLFTQVEKISYALQTERYGGDIYEIFLKITITIKNTKSS